VTNPVLAPVRLLPVAGRQLRSLTALSAAAGQVARVGAATMRESETVLALPHREGPDRIALLQRVTVMAERADRDLAHVPLGPANALIHPIATKRAEFSKDLDQLRTGLRRGGAAAAGLADLLQGPHRYLLLAANNAEMRSGSGSFLAAGVIQTDGGRITLGPTQQTADLLLDGDQVALTGDLADRWGWLQPNREWRNLATTPQFDVTGALAAQMWKAKTGEDVDGVLAVDVEALREVLKVTGAVPGPLGPVNKDNVVHTLLHDQYLVGDPLSATRHENQGAVAATAMAAIQQGGVDVLPLGSGLARAVEGRHLLLWSAQPSTESTWVRAGAAGTTAPEDLFVAVLNRGGNKLDQYLQVTSDLARTQKGSVSQFELRIRLHNTAPTGEPPYIAGPNPLSGVGEGVYSGILAVDLPGAVGRAGVDGVSSFAAIGSEGPSEVLGVSVTVARGESVEYVVRFQLRGDHGMVRFEPSARVPAVAWTAPGMRFTDDKPHVLRW
jgi:hypothetical protein